MFDIRQIICKYFKNLFDTFDLLLYLTHFSFAKQFGHDDWQGYGSFIHRWTKQYSIVNKAICSTKESQQMQMN